jgi:GTP-binding protein
MIPFEKTQFLKSAMNLSDLPKDHGIEIAFAGRSNAGKSSALNTLTGVQGLAKTSKTPGRTQTINLFEMLPLKRWVDLPGYGFAKVPLPLKQKWEQTLNEYLQNRVCLKGLFLIMDIRHPLKSLDQHMIEWASSANLPVHILLTKSDKLSRGKALQTLHDVQKRIDKPTLITAQIFSSLNGEGLKEARKKLNAWFMAC